jgi:Tfp pilus assembly protein FimT
MPLRKQTDGLSLIELLATMALAGALGGVALLELGRTLADWRLAAAARQVVLDLEVARMRSIAENAGHRLRFTADATAYARERESDSGRYDALATPRALPEGVAIAACTARGSAVTFRPRGQPTTYGTITLRGENGRERRVIIDAAGRARIE